MNVQQFTLYGSLRRKGLMWFAPLFGVAIMVILAACPSGDNAGDTAAPTGWTIAATGTTSGTITVTLTNPTGGSEPIAAANYAIYLGTAATVTNAPANYNAIMALTGADATTTTDGTLAATGTFTIPAGDLANDGSFVTTEPATVATDGMYVVYVAVQDAAGNSAQQNTVVTTTGAPPPGDTEAPTGWTVAAGESSATADVITIVLDNSSGNEQINGARFAIYRGAAPVSPPVDYDALVAGLGTAVLNRTDAGLVAVADVALTGGVLANAGANTIITVDITGLDTEVGTPGYIVYMAVTDGTNGSTVMSVAGVTTDGTPTPTIMNIGLKTGSATATGFSVEYDLGVTGVVADVYWAAQLASVADIPDDTDGFTAIKKCCYGRDLRDRYCNGG